jgi:hypothetical protein
VTRGRRKNRLTAAAKLCSAVLFFLFLKGNNAYCGTIPTITTPSLTVAAITPHSLTVARSVNVTTGTAIVDAWMSAGSKALQDDNSDALRKDTSCPVVLTRSLSISTFSASYDIIDSDAKFIALSTTVPQQIKIVSRITICGGKSPPFGAPTFNGCANPVQILLAADAPLTPESLAHEYGHYKGLGHRTVTGQDRWIMWAQGLPNRNIVESSECSAYMR